MAAKLLQAFSRRKTDSDGEEKSNLARVLNLFDLTALGVGSTLGLGVYVMAGEVSKSDAGPAVCIAFLVAAVASAFAALCYAEFAARVPKAGSAYVYSYVTVGEFVAFVIGWNLILEYVIGTASVARGLSNYVDALIDKQISMGLNKTMPIRVEFLSDYPDFFSFGLILALTVILSLGVKESTLLNNIFTALNLLTVAIVVVAGSIKADPGNWDISKETCSNATKTVSHAGKCGEGGFMPFGMAGVMAGAAKCFFGFVGFDSIATTGEEAKKPQRDIPLAIIISLFIIFSVYFSISTVVTMMWPYYLQDSDAPLPYVFGQIGWYSIKWIVSIGAIFALCTSLLGAMFPLPRIIYAMANDGLIFRTFADIHPRTHVPIKATFLSGLLSGLMATFFNLQELINMMSIGTLLAYSIVAVCVLILRYQPVERDVNYAGFKVKETDVNKSMFNTVRDLFNLNMNKEPNSTSSNITNWTIGIFSIFSALFCALVIYAIDTLFTEPLCIVAFIITLIAMVTLLVIISRQPMRNEKLSFKVPLLPILPCLSVIFNVYLMLELDVQTWIRFVGWLIVGFIIYFTYGLKNSSEYKKQLQLQSATSATTNAKSNNANEESIKEDTKF